MRKILLLILLSAALAGKTFTSEEMSPDAVRAVTEAHAGLFDWDTEDTVFYTIGVMSGASYDKGFSYQYEYVYYTTNTTLHRVLNLKNPVHELIVLESLPALMKSAGNISVTANAAHEHGEEDGVVWTRIRNAEGTVRINYTVEKELNVYQMNDEVRTWGAPVIIAVPAPHCLNNGVCEDFEQGRDCIDCYVPSCADDGECTEEERSLGNCFDCMEHKKPCVIDGVCEEYEQEMNCPDCLEPEPVKEDTTASDILVGALLAAVAFAAILGAVHFYKKSKEVQYKDPYSN
ncbi:MAG: hypothetical protein JW834_00535 [Candidatus Diapherotrites archaeon]|nr:hypothetical protein [Candidatus Diapherotrites archaeon]